MKNRTNVILLAVFLLSLPVCVWAWFGDIWLLLFLPAVPAFSLQLLLCRAVRRRRAVKALPLLAVAGMALWGGWICGTVTGWDALAGVFLLLGAISPAVGIAAGWLTAWLSARAARGREAGREQ